MWQLGNRLAPQIVNLIPSGRVGSSPTCLTKHVDATDDALSESKGGEKPSTNNAGDSCVNPHAGSNYGTVADVVLALD